jgi:hypothetical protein
MECIVSLGLSCNQSGFVIRYPVWEKVTLVVTKKMWGDGGIFDETGENPQGYLVFLYF